MHDTMGVTEVESLQNLVKINAHIEIVEASGNYLCLTTRHVLVNEARCLRGRLLDHVTELNDVGSAI